MFYILTSTMDTEYPRASTSSISDGARLQVHFIISIFEALYSILMTLFTLTKRHSMCHSIVGLILRNSRIWNVVTSLLLQPSGQQWVFSLVALNPSLELQNM